MSDLRKEILAIPGVYTTDGSNPKFGGYLNKNRWKFKGLIKELNALRLENFRDMQKINKKR